MIERDAFTLGRIFVAPTAKLIILESKVTAALSRHRRCDFGDCSDAEGFLGVTRKLSRPSPGLLVLARRRSAKQRFSIWYQPGRSRRYLAGETPTILLNILLKALSD